LGLLFFAIAIFVFTNPSDGDYHVHVLVDEQYRDLPKVDFVLFPYSLLLRTMSFVIPFLVIVSYLIVSIIKPRHIGPKREHRFYIITNLGAF
jgi:hypothetical protein